MDLSSVEKPKMTRLDLIEMGLLLEVGPVRDHDPALKRALDADSICFTNDLWVDRLKGEKPVGISDYDMIVQLLGTFVVMANQAPQGTESMVFSFDQYVKNQDQFKLVPWVCKVSASVEDGLRCLTFRELKEKSNG